MNPYKSPEIQKETIIYNIDVYPLLTGGSLFLICLAFLLESLNIVVIENPLVTVNSIYILFAIIINVWLFGFYMGKKYGPRRNSNL